MDGEVCLTGEEFQFQFYSEFKMDMVIDTQYEHLMLLNQTLKMVKLCYVYFTIKKILKRISTII